MARCCARGVPDNGRLIFEIKANKSRTCFGFCKRINFDSLTPHRHDTKEITPKSVAKIRVY
jgi:hypothetical protein